VCVCKYVQKLYKMQGSRIDEKKKELWKVPTLEEFDVNNQCNIISWLLVRYSSNCTIKYDINFSFIFSI